MQLFNCMSDLYIKNYYPDGFHFSQKEIISFPALKKIQEHNNGVMGDKPTEDDYIRAGYEILNIVITCFRNIDEIYPKIKELQIYSVDQLMPKGIVNIGNQMGVNLEEEVRKKFGEDFYKEKYIPIRIPDLMIGSGTYVIFEIPNTKEEIPQRPPIEISK